MCRYFISLRFCLRHFWLENDLILTNSGPNLTDACLGTKLAFNWNWEIKAYMLVKGRCFARKHANTEKCAYLVRVRVSGSLCFKSRWIRAWYITHLPKCLCLRYVTSRFYIFTAIWNKRVLLNIFYHLNFLWGRPKHRGIWKSAFNAGTVARSLWQWVLYVCRAAKLAGRLHVQAILSHALRSQLHQRLRTNERHRLEKPLLLFRWL